MSPVALPALLLCLSAAALTNLALQSRLASLALALAVAAVVAVLFFNSERRKPQVYAPAAIALGSAVVCALRVSPWITGPAILAMTSALLVASQDQLGALLIPVQRFSRDVPRIFEWLGLSRISKTVGKSNGRSIAREAAVAVAVVVPLGLLLASGDAIFAGFLGSILSGSFLGHMFLTALLLLPISALAVGASRSKIEKATSSTSKASSAAPFEQLIPLAAVFSLLTFWSASQIAVFIGGAERFLNTADTTAAEYIHEGFFQLVAAAALVAAVITVMGRRGKYSGRARQVAIFLNVALGLETIGLIGITYSRLVIYVRGFGLTMLRLSVAWFLAWLVLAIVVVVASVALPNWKPSRTAKVVYLSLGIWVIAFGASNPEAFVVERNVAATASANSGDNRRTIDVSYLLADLGSDAIPAIVSNLDNIEGREADRIESALCAQTPYQNRYGFLSFNRSTNEANKAIASLSC